MTKAMNVSVCGSVCIVAILLFGFISELILYIARLLSIHTKHNIEFYHSYSCKF